MAMICEKPDAIRTFETLVDGRPLGICIAIVVCERPQGIRTSVTVVDDTSPAICIAMLT